MKTRLSTLTILVCLLALTANARSVVELNGAWQFRLDPQAVGDSENWQSTAVPFPNMIQVPGCWQAQGVGEPAGVIRNQYAGVAWYRRTIVIPREWQGKVLALQVGGVIREAVVFVNGQRVGQHDGFSTPFSFDITGYARPGEQNTVVFRVASADKSIKVTPPKQRAQMAPRPPVEYMTGAMNYLSNWGGIYGNVAIEAAEPLRIEYARITPDITASVARIRIAVRNYRPEAKRSVRVEALVENAKVDQEISLDAGGQAEVDLNVGLPGAVLWTPENPHLYTARIRLLEGSSERDRVEERFGMREITTRGTALLLNGKPLYLRGGGDDSLYVLTGTPPVSKEVYTARLRQMRAFGFNAARFHSATPVREYFEAADEVGILVLAELPAVYTPYFLPHKELLAKEMERILYQLWNHPSFLSLAFGNELSAGGVAPERRKEFADTIETMYRRAKSIAPHRLILGTDGGLLYPTDMLSIYPRGGGRKDVPTIRHEFGDYYCSLPDPSSIEKYVGVLRPLWLEEKKRWAEENGLAGVYPNYVRNSRRLLQMGHKFQIEAVRSRPETTGYEYWLLTDYPGGTGEGDSWEEGWFDLFWHPKDIEPREGKELNSPVAIMIGAGVDDRTLWSGTRKPIDIWVSNYGDAPMEAGVLDWELFAGGGSVGRGSLPNLKTGLGQVARVALLEMQAPAAGKAQKLELVLTLKTNSASYTNRWNFWSFPRQGIMNSSPVPVISSIRWFGLNRLFPFVQARRAELPDDGVLITRQLDVETRDFLEAGGKVWLMADRLELGRSGSGAKFFPGRGGALGTLVQDHPALEGFPHDGLLDLQFYNLVEGSTWFSLDSWPKELTPIAGAVRTAADWLNASKPLSRVGFVVEVKVGKGKLLITSLNLGENLDEACPEAVFLVDRLLRYVTGSQFTPSVEVDSSWLGRLLR